ncbi:MAG: hypothetical protein ACYSTF_07075 [Planctomycetota bacterium]|jgi:hypothetical protein
MTEKVLEILVITLAGLALGVAGAYLFIRFLLVRVVMVVVVHLPALWHKVWYEVLPGGEGRRKQHQEHLRRKRREMFEKIDQVIAGEIQVSDAKLASFILELSSYRKLYQTLVEVLAAMTNEGDEEQIQNDARVYYEATLGMGQDEIQRNQERLNNLLRIRENPKNKRKPARR